MAPPPNADYLERWELHLSMLWGTWTVNSNCRDPAHRSAARRGCFTELESSQDPAATVGGAPVSTSRCRNRLTGSPLLLPPFLRW